LDDLGYVQQSREVVNINLVFSKWDQIFKDPMTTMAAVDRLVHHAIILEFDGESIRTPERKGADRKGGNREQHDSDAHFWSGRSFAFLLVQIARR
jgi:hypothetical protein